MAVSTGVGIVRAPAHHRRTATGRHTRSSRSFGSGCVGLVAPVRSRRSLRLSPIVCTPHSRATSRVRVRGTAVGSATAPCAFHCQCTMLNGSTSSCAPRLHRKSALPQTPTPTRTRTNMHARTRTQRHRTQKHQRQARVHANCARAVSCPPPPLQPETCQPS